ncbi:hypothetical protein [Hymenobacter sp. CRA2]|uniref:hypothetical protein n=1 Tax=Hymenobacter sp. CRA2 TaxID=1955620 RepID=UPI00098EAE1F|nr:hypothetical protein [Hymenobacter sp. CRA2]OON70111.1 hypothetical protein B0919_05060 [Hymenobacter sp. CRA2]
MQSATAAVLLILASCTGMTDAQLAQLSLAEHSLRNYNEQADRTNGYTVWEIRAEAERNGWQPKDSAIVTQATQLHTRTQTLRRYFDDTRHQLLASTDNDAEARTLTAEREVRGLMLPEKPARISADTLQQRLRAYSQYVQQLSPAPVRLGASPAEEIRLHGPALAQVKKLSFSQFYFNDTPVAAALLSLAQLEAQVLQRETDVMRQFQIMGGSHHHDMARIGAFAVSESNWVPAGGTYRARLFLVRSESRLRNLRMTANGQPVPVTGGWGEGQVQIPIPANQPPGPAVWEGTISGKYYGQDTTFRVRVPYTVVHQ